MSYKPPLIAFIGPSGSGKTTLLEKLIKHLKSEGFRVGAIKHSHHQIEIDKEGKDSYRFRQAGSNPTVVAGSNFIGFMETSDKPAALADLARFLDGKADIILVEGFKGESVSGEPVQKFVFGPPFGQKEEGSLEDENILGIIACEPGAGESSGKPVFQRDDVKALGDWIKQHFLNNFKKD